MSDLSKVCDQLRKKYGLKSFSVGVNYGDKRMDVYTSEYRVYRPFEFEGFLVDVSVHGPITNLEMPDVEDFEAEEIEEIPDVEEFTDTELEENLSTEEIEVPDLIEDTPELEKWDIPELEDFDFEKVESIKS